MATSPASGPVERREGSLSGARADFVAQLGRRVSELRVGLQALENEPTAARPRDDLKRRFHALGSAARVLKFQALADELMRLEQSLMRASAEGTLDGSRLAAMRADVDSLVSLAWGEAAPPPVPPSAEEGSVALTWPATALVVGDALVAEALLPEMSAPGDVMLDCERVAETAEALEMARALAPDVVVLDTELAGSQELVEKLANDALTEPVPVVAIGSFSSSERAARWVALGVARVLARPFTPRQLQEACFSVISMAHHPPRPEPFGQLTLEQLAVRLNDEIRRGLSEAALDQGRLIPIPFGDGHEVMAAIWSALVRIREAATVRSSGLVRFQNIGPEGAVAVASWTSESRGGRLRRSAEGEAPQRLDGRSVLVVDDDPSVTWFLAGVLRAAGASVLEAHDGEAALRLAQRHCPELVISDILMPRMDGFALCRALKRDVVLRDVPVILLSWKEDLLQRVRELGANADGYLRKEASAAVVLERVFEVLRTRLRVERRLLAGGEVRGRLDDLTVRTLLAQVTRLQPNTRVSVRDAAYFYEVEIRDGIPRSATRTTPKGNFERGHGVLFNLLGVGAGRFVVTPSDAPLRGWLEGTLDEQVRPAVAQIRAAQRLLSGTELMNVQGVDMNLEAIQPYLEASPTVSRDILDKLAEGFSPRALLLRGGYSARLLEDVLNDAILHGGVARIVGTGGEDLLPMAVEQEMAFLESGARAEESPAPPAAALYAQITPSPLQLPVAPVPTPLPASLSPAAAADPQPQPQSAAEAAAADVPSGAKVPPEREGTVRVEATSVAPTWTRAPATPSPFESALLEASSEAPPAVEFTNAPRIPLLLGTPLQVSVEEVPMREPTPSDPLVLATPLQMEPLEEVPVVLPVPAEHLTPEPALLGASSLPSPAVEVPPAASEVGASGLAEVAVLAASARAEASVSGLSLGGSGEGLAGADGSGGSSRGLPPVAEVPAGSEALASLAALGASDDGGVTDGDDSDEGGLGGADESASEGAEARAEEGDVSRETSATAPPRGTPGTKVSEKTSRADVSRETSMAPELSPGPQMVSQESGDRKATKARRGPWGGVLGVLLLGVLGSAWALQETPGSRSTASQAPVRSEEIGKKSDAATGTGEKGAPGKEGASGGGQEEPLGSVGALEPKRTTAEGLGIEDLPLPAGESVPEGQGLLEVLAGQRDEVLVGRREVGRGPEVRVALPPGVHELRSRRKGDEQPLTVVVRAGRRTKVDMRGPWRRLQARAEGRRARGRGARSAGGRRGPLTFGGCGWCRWRRCWRRGAAPRKRRLRCRGNPRRRGP